MHDLLIVLCGIVSTTLFLAWMLRNDISFADLDAWWNRQFENFGSWFMYCFSFDERKP